MVPCPPDFSPRLPKRPIRLRRLPRRPHASIGRRHPGLLAPRPPRQPNRPHGGPPPRIEVGGQRRRRETNRGFLSGHSAPAIRPKPLVTTRRNASHFYF